jgi:RNA polymerase primary sigma factor
MPEMYMWQREAYREWKRNDYVGIIEAVTGSGKTLIAHYAMINHLKDGYDVLIIVPTVELQKQWFKDIRKLKDSDGNLIKNKYRITLLGGGNNNPDIIRWNIIIAVVNSAINKRLNPRNQKGLLIADECHHYGAQKFKDALKSEYNRRLGLTATYQREDNGIEDHLNPYFQRICYSLSYRQALNEKVIAHFKIAFVGVDLDRKERSNYENYEEKCRCFKEKLIQSGVVENPFGEFVRKVGILSQESSQLGQWARGYLKFFSDKRSLLANTTNKYSCLKYLSDVIKKADRTIIFSQTKEGADKAINTLRKENINADVLNSSMGNWVIKEVLADFESGDTDVVAAPLLLDEGINVPSADLAIIMASSRNKRQMIQRMGRVLRKKINNGIAKIIIIYAKRTSEDPEEGAHEVFIEDIIDVADDIEYFDHTNIEKLIEYI